MRTFTINNKVYDAKPFDYNTVCDLEDKGVSLMQMRDKPMSIVRSYFSLCSRLPLDAAGREIEAHVVGGGTINDIYDVMSVEMNESGFFQALNKTTEEDTPKVQIEKKK